MSQTGQIFKKATFAMGCFWGPDGLFGCTPGVTRTRVGYCGGTTQSPTYTQLGDHTETIDIDYDPGVTNYERLLELFWKNHDPTVQQKLQYRSAIFYRDDEQKKLAEESKTCVAKELRKSPVTDILPFTAFYNAEGYHQKYHLQTLHPSLFESLNQNDVITSTIAARLNGYVSGHGCIEAFNKELETLDLSPEQADYIREQIKNPNYGSC